MNWWVESTKRFVQLYYIEHFLILAATITWCILISVFASLHNIAIGITSSAIGLKISVIASGIKKSLIKKDKKKHDKMVLLAKSTLNGIEVLISKVLINSNISHNGFVLINNGLKEYDHMKEKIKNLKT